MRINIISAGTYLTFLCVLSAGGNQSGVATPEKNWKNRRSQKLEKMELLNLQSNLQSEIHAKIAINEELSRVRSELEASRMDVRDYKSRIEGYSREMLRKEAQIRDLQQMVDKDGCKSTFSLLPLSKHINPLLLRGSRVRVFGSTSDLNSVTRCFTLFFS